MAREDKIEPKKTIENEIRSKGATEQILNLGSIDQWISKDCNPNL